MNRPCMNTDKELWRKDKDDFYSPSIHVTERGEIGINVGGYVTVASVEDWHEAMEHKLRPSDKLVEKILNIGIEFEVTIIPEFNYDEARYEVAKARIHKLLKGKK